MKVPDIQRLLTTIAGALGTAVVVLPVAAYLLLAWSFEDERLAVEAEYVARSVNSVVVANPDLWRYEHVRLVEFLSTRLGDGESRRIVDANGRIVASVGAPVAWPPLSRSWAVMDAGTAVARVEVTHTLRPVAIRAGILGLLLAPIALVSFLVLRSLPMRAIRQREEALRSSEARFRALTERATDMVMVFDADHRITYWSPSATETLGWNRSEVLGKAPEEIGLLHPEDVASLELARRATHASSRDPFLLTARHRHKDGSWRIVEGSARDLLLDPEVRGVVVNARDVTVQRQLEEQLRQSQKLESIGRLAGGVAHDFNNLLTVIMGGAAGLQEALDAGRPADPEDVAQIQEAAERARDFTTQLLAFARRQVIVPVPVDLNAILRANERLLRRVLGEDVRLEIAGQDGLWPVLCDPGQLEQLLLNLAANARDAMPRGGTLSIETRNVAGAGDGSEVQTGEWVELRVRDSGSGMSPEVQARIFEPFFTTKEVGKGTGLGLATVHGIVTQNGGRVRVESEPGRGTTFEVRFPRTQVGSVPVRPATAPRPSRGSEVVLVVEDDPRVRAVTVRALQGAGHRVLAAADGPEALAIAGASATPLDLVVSDVVMPGMSGRAVVDALRRRQPGLRALFVSGYPEDAIARRGVLEEGVAFLAKPFAPTTLVARVRALLDAPGPDAP